MFNMSKTKKQQKPLFSFNPTQRKPLIDIGEKAKRKPLSSFFDEDMHFIIDTYQEGLKRVVTPHSENKMRDKLLRRIAKKSCPEKIPILDQIDMLTDDVKKERVTLKSGLNRLQQIARRHSAPKLLPGIEEKINSIHADGKRKSFEWMQQCGIDLKVNRRQLPISTNTQKRKPIINIDINKKEERNIALFSIPRNQRMLKTSHIDTGSSKQRQKKRERLKRVPLIDIFAPVSRLSPLPPVKTKTRRRKK